MLHYLTPSMGRQRFAVTVGIITALWFIGGALLGGFAPITFLILLAIFSILSIWRLKDMGYGPVYALPFMIVFLGGAVLDRWLYPWVGLLIQYLPLVVLSVWPSKKTTR